MPSVVQPRIRAAPFSHDDAQAKLMAYMRPMRRPDGLQIAREVLVIKVRQLTASSVLRTA